MDECKKKRTDGKEPGGCVGFTGWMKNVQMEGEKVDRQKRIGWIYRKNWMDATTVEWTE
jgi:hypothetical protein